MNAGQKDPGTVKSLNPLHWPRSPFDHSMVLLDRVIEIFGLADLDGRFAIGIDRFEGCEIGAVFVDGNRLGYTVPVETSAINIVGHANSVHLQSTQAAH